MMTIKSHSMNAAKLLYRKHNYMTNP